MIITYHGEGCVKLQYGENTILLNSPSKHSDAKQLKTTAQIHLTSARVQTVDERINNDSNSFSIYGPGEYEVNGIFVQGFPSSTSWKGELQNNVIYSFTFDDMKIVSLGYADTTELDTSFIESIDAIDILFIPIAGSGTLESSAAYDLAVKLQPKIIIPTHISGIDDDNLVQFLKESGNEISPEDKLTIKRKDLAEKENEVHVLSIQ